MWSNQIGLAEGQVSTSRPPSQLQPGDDLGHAASLFHRSSGSRLPPLPMLPNVPYGLSMPQSLQEAPRFDLMNTLLSSSLTPAPPPLIVEPDRNFADNVSEPPAAWDLGSLHNLAGLCQKVHRLSRDPIEAYAEPLQESKLGPEIVSVDDDASCHSESKTASPAAPSISESVIVVQESKHSNVGEETKTTPSKRKRKPRLKIGDRDDDSDSDYHDSDQEDVWFSPSIKERRTYKKKNVSPVPARDGEAPSSPRKIVNQKKLVSKARGNTNPVRPSRQVSGKDEHVCPYEGCTKAFLKPSALERHVRTHTGERPFVCLYPDCGLSFSERGNLKRHQRVHTGEKPYACEYAGCHSSFARKSHLIQHENTRHNGFQSETSRSKERRKSSSDPCTIVDLRNYDLPSLLSMLPPEVLVPQSIGPCPPPPVPPVPSVPSVSSVPSVPSVPYVPSAPPVVSTGPSLPLASTAPPASLPLTSTGAQIRPPEANLPPPVIIQPQDESFANQSRITFPPRVSQPTPPPPFSEMLEALALDAMHSDPNFNANFSSSKPLPRFEYGESLRNNAAPNLFGDVNGAIAYSYQQLELAQAEAATFNTSLSLGSFSSLSDTTPSSHHLTSCSTLPSLDFLSATYGRGASDVAGPLPSMRPDPLPDISSEPIAAMGSEPFPSMRLPFSSSLECSPSMDFPLSQDSCISAFSTTSLYNGPMAEGLPSLDLSSWATTPSSSHALSGVPTVSQAQDLAPCSSPDLSQHVDNRSTLLLSPLLPHIGDIESEQHLP